MTLHLPRTACVHFFKPSPILEGTCLHHETKYRSNLLFHRNGANNLLPCKLQLSLFMYSALVFNKVLQDGQEVFRKH